MKIIIISAILATAVAAPGLYISEESNLIHTEPLTAKSTITKSSQVVDHGTTYIHTPIAHELHPVVSVVHTVHSVPVVHAKTTVTKSNHVVNHGGSAIVHAPVHYVSEYHAPVKTTVTKSNHIVNHGGATVVHTPVHLPVYVEHGGVKTTVTKSNQIVNHGGSTIVHAPVVVKSGDSAVSHQSSTVHETKTAPLYAYHSYHY